MTDTFAEPDRPHYMHCLEVHIINILVFISLFLNTAIPICKIYEEDSLTEVWKRLASFTDFLEKYVNPHL